MIQNAVDLDQQIRKAVILDCVLPDVNITSGKNLSFILRHEYREETYEDHAGYSTLGIKSAIYRIPEHEREGCDIVEMHSWELTLDQLVT